MTDVFSAYRLLIADVYELAGLSRRVSEHEAGAQGTTAARWHVLSVVSDDPATVPAIARRLGQARQSVQRVVDDLVETEWLSMTTNPAHRRSPLVAITDSGTRSLEQLWRTSEPRRRDALARSGVDAAELRHARACLRQLTAALKGGSA